MTNLAIMPMQTKTIPMKPVAVASVEKIVTLCSNCNLRDLCLPCGLADDRHALGFVHHRHQALANDGRILDDEDVSAVVVTVLHAASMGVRARPDHRRFLKLRVSGRRGRP